MKTAKAESIRRNEMLFSQLVTLKMYTNNIYTYICNMYIYISNRGVFLSGASENRARAMGGRPDEDV